MYFYNLGYNSTTFQMYYGANPVLFEYARKLRVNETEAEKILWTYLCNKKINGLRFRRQHPILYFIADFFCPSAKLVIEVDGGVHNLPAQFEYDRNRDSELSAYGLKVLRFTNEEVMNNIDKVIQKIVQAAQIDLNPHG
jgi:cyclase